MNSHRKWLRLLVVIAAVALTPWASEVGRAQSKVSRANTTKTPLTLQKTITDAKGRKHTRARKVTHSERKAAAERLRKKQIETLVAAGADPIAAAAMALTLPEIAPGTGMLVGPNGQLVPDYSGTVPNFANSPQRVGTCSVTTAEMCFLDSDCPAGETCAAFTGGIRKFIDRLPGLGAANANGLGQYLPIAVPDPTSFPGSDYYEIELGEYSEQMHTDLPPTRLRGYRQTNGGDPNFHYLGPIIVAQKGRPVRIKFTNNLPTGEAGNLFLPVDTTVMGAGAGPNTSDAVRMTQAGQLCVGIECYTQNRATIHLHGGVTPWISDGTTHQWVTPADETTSYPNGVSVFNVPDMEAVTGVPPGKPATNHGAQTFYYTNDQSARLMFYHDHAHGITRLNVYAGEAAGYVITDEMEAALQAPGGPLEGLGVGIPLILQDKTFVDANLIKNQDPTWNWGTGPASTYTDPTGKTMQLHAPVTGDLWWPHVYQPAQNPYDITGVNAMGRWVYGPWFWPPTTGIPFLEVANPYYDCNAFGLPDATHPCTRPWQPVTIPGTPNPSITAEAFFDTPVVNGTAYPYLEVPAGLVRFRILNASHDRFWNLSLYVASHAPGQDTTLFPLPTEVALNPQEVADAKDAPFEITPTPVATPGPNWMYIGTEGGFLPMPVDVPAQPVTYVNDPTVFNAGNVDKHSLLLGPAERADVLVDFSAFAGQTLILYNDAPAAFPARDPRFDYYTDSADNRDTGGTAPTVAGYGPNTRTVMQIRVGSAPGRTTTFASLKAAWANVFATGQDDIIVGQTAYNETYSDRRGGVPFAANYPCWGIVRIQDNSMCVETVGGQRIFLPLEAKAIQDEMGEAFDDYGRMSTNLGLELPFTNAGTQNFVLQSYADPPTELVRLSDKAVPLGEPLKDGTQIWKITHNGVDTHPTHFHLFHVQLINRVGWDGGIRLPHPTELGWKDTVRISPLEDTIVALRPIAPTPADIPWPLPNSTRALEPALPIGSLLGFNNRDPLGNPVTITNELTNFGWEYIWHCHILSHEEHDMMRAIGFAVPPEAPGPLSAVPDGGRIILTWTDNSVVTTGFTVQRASDANFTADVVDTPLGMATTFIDDTVAEGTYFYRVSASNTIGSTVPGYPTMTANSDLSNTVEIAFVPPSQVAVSPSSLEFGPQLVNTNSIIRTIAVTNIGTSVLTINSVRFSLPDFLRAGGTCNGTLGIGRTCTIGVRFRPTATGPRAGEVQIVHSSSGSPAVVALSGTGIAPVASVSPAALAFASPLNLTSAAQTVTVTNTGTAPLAITNVTRSGPHSGQFIAVPSCPGSLAVGASCTIDVFFRPTSPSPLTKTANLNVVVASPATNATIALTGGIIVPTFTISPSPVAFGTQSVAGGAKTMTVTVSNTGQAPLRITGFSRTSATQFPPIQNVNCPISPSTLAAGASCTVTAVFNPTSAGVKNSTLTVTVGAPAANQSVPMSGTGILP